MKNYLTEFIGTFFLVLTIALAVGSGTDMAPIAIWVILMVMVYMGGHISGAHYNPAVTLWLLMRGKISINESVMYWISQILWGLVAVTVAYFLGQGWAGPALGAWVSSWQAIVAELLFTFALVSVVIHSAATKATSGNSYYGLAIWFTVLAAAFAAGGISGGAFNPAVGLGPWVYESLVGGSANSDVWIHIVWPLLWWVLAALFHGFAVGNE